MSLDRRPHNTAARHAEIARRYARHKRERFGPYDRGRHRCAEVLRLAQRRRSEDRLDFDPDELIADIQDNPRRSTARAIGQRLKLTWAERVELRLTTMDPCDISPAEFKRRKRQRRILLTRERSRRYRQRQKAKKKTPKHGPKSIIPRHATVQWSRTYRKAALRLRFLRVQGPAHQRDA